MDYPSGCCVHNQVRGRTCLRGTAAGGVPLSAAPAAGGIRFFFENVRRARVGNHTLSPISLLVAEFHQIGGFQPPPFNSGAGCGAHCLLHEIHDVRPRSRALVHRKDSPDLNAFSLDCLDNLTHQFRIV